MTSTSSRPQPSPQLHAAYKLLDTRIVVLDNCDIDLKLCCISFGEGPSRGKCLLTLSHLRIY